MPTVSVIELTRFQFASTALTVTLNAPPAVCAVGVPVLPVAVPGAAVSPGRRIWSLRERGGVDRRGRARVGGHRAVADVGRGERLRAGGLRRDREASCVPATSAALAGSVAFASLEVMRDGVGGGDRVPVGVDRVDGDVEAAAGGLRGRCAGLAGGGAGGGGLARQQDLKLGERAGVDRRRRARVRGHRAVR